MGFESYHPAVNLVFFTFALFAALSFDHPVFIAISLLSALLYSVKRKGIKALVFGLVLILLSALFALYYGSFSHFGVTVLGKNRIGNDVTLESFAHGFASALMVSSAVIWTSCMFSVFTSDKVVYLVGRISPRLSLFLSVLLRTAPRVRREAGRINSARTGIGKGACRGSAPARIRGGICVFSATLGRMIEFFASSSDSIRCRGGSLRGRKAFSIYRFDNRDRAFVVAMFAFITAAVAAVILGQTDMIFDPRLILPPVSPTSYLFYTAYAAFCMMPLTLELFTELNFRTAKKRAFPERSV